MLKVKILCVGRQARNWLSDAESDYRQRIGAFADLSIEFVPPEDEHKLGAAGTAEKEGEKLLNRIKADDYVIACELDEEELDSMQFSKVIGELNHAGEHVVFVIGGSHGLSDTVLRRTQRKIAFSKLTFPHELFRVLLLEQIYRGLMILAGKLYHK